MSERKLNRYAGTFSMSDTAKVPGELLLEETKATFISNRGTEVISFAINDMQKLQNTRHGNISSTISITLKSGESFKFTLDRGVPAYDYMNARWTDRPQVQKSRADELRRLAELRGERIEKPQKLSEAKRHKFRVAALIMILLIVLLDTGWLASILVFVLNGLSYYLRFLSPAAKFVENLFNTISQSSGWMLVINIVLIVITLLLLSKSFKRRHPNRSNL